MVQPNPGARYIDLEGSELLDILGLDWEFCTAQAIANLASFKKLVQVDADYTVELRDDVINVDASGGDVTITYDPALVPYPNRVQVTRINKTDDTSNAVLISDGVNVVDQILATASIDGYVGGWRDVFGDGITLYSAGVG